MTTTPFFHGTSSLKRTWAASPARVFNAWADPRSNRNGSPGPSTSGSSCDALSILGPGVLKCWRVDPEKPIEQDWRLVYDYDLHHGGNFHSVTLSSLMLEPEGRSTRVSYTGQIVFLDGKDGTASLVHGTALQFVEIEKAILGKELMP